MSDINWATLVPLWTPILYGVKRRKEGSTRGLLLQASFGGRSRKAARGSHTFGPPEHHWTLGKGPTSLGYYQRREELRGNKPKNRCPLKVKNACRGLSDLSVACRCTCSLLNLGCTKRSRSMSMRDHNSLPNLARETLGTPCLDTRLTRQAHMCEQSAAMVSKLRSLEDTDTVDILACESNSQTHDSFGYPSNLQI